MVGFILGTVLSIKQANFEERRTNQVRNTMTSKRKVFQQLSKERKDLLGKIDRLVQSIIKKVKLKTADAKSDSDEKKIN